MKLSKNLKSIKSKLKLRKKVEPDEMTKALKTGKMSHKDLAGIITRFQAYEVQSIKNVENNVPPDTDTQIKARNIVADRTSLEFNLMRKESSIDRSPSNFLLKGFGGDRKA